MRGLADLALPEAAHRPGSGSQPDLAPLEAAKALCPRRVEPADWERNAAYLYGAGLYDQGYYWEAHEVWEAVWRASPPNGEGRHLLLALIQLANAALKLALDRPGAALRLLEASRSALAECRQPKLMGLDLPGLADGIEAAAQMIRETETADPGPAPLRPVALPKLALHGDFSQKIAGSKGE